MALLFADSWDDRTATTYLKWDSPETWSGYPAARTGNGGQMNSAGAYSNHKTLPSNHATLIAGAAFKFLGGVTSANKIFIGFLDGSTRQIYAQVNADATISVKNGDGTTLGTSVQALDASSFFYIELKATIHDTTGSFELRVDGVARITGSNVDTKNTANAYANKLEIRQGINSESIVVDDLYVCDTSGSYNNDFISAVKIERLLPSGAGNTTQWTPSAGSNYQNVDDATANGDTDYNSDATIGNKDTYAMGNLAASTGTVKAVQVGVVAEKDDAVARSFCRVIRSGGTDYDGSNISPANGVYARTMEVVETDPATSAAWTIANVNAMELGVKTTA